MPSIHMLAHLQSRIAAGDSFDYLHFWGHRERPDGVVSATCFSQWYPDRFEIDGVFYASAEHFMMALVEASPVDAIWGIGMAADDPRASNPLHWQGLDLLGFALMVVRDRLAS